MDKSNTLPQDRNSGSKRTAGFYLLQIIRIIVGLLFIFSGLVKANDPSGLAYKMQEFFEVWQITWLSPYALGLSIAMIAFEIIAGVALLLGYFFRFFSVLLLVLMVFFTFLTAYAAFSGKIKECGCFGDCIPLQAMQSFWKDVILLILVLILVACRQHIRPVFKRYINTSLMILTLFGSLFMQWYVLQHLPFVDCLPYKIGNNIWEKMQPPPGSKPDVFQTTYTLAHRQSGESRKMSDQEYIESGIWQDSLWEIVGEPEQILIEKGNATPEIQDFHISDYVHGNDYTEALLKEPGYNFLFFLRDPATAKTDKIGKLAALAERCSKNNVGFFVLSSGSGEATEAFLAEHGIRADYFVLDGTVSKTAMRSNPGLMLIKAGTIKGKWSYRDYPSGFKWISPERLTVFE